VTTSPTRALAKIERTFLGFEDHGILTGFVHVTYGGSAQGVGGYDLRTGSAAAEFVTRMLKACGVFSWEQLAGRTIYVLTDETGRVVGVENLPTERGERFLFTDIYRGVDQ
jgi:hypothetical protein